MKPLKLVRLIGAVTVVASAPVVLALAAHAQAPAPSDQQTLPRPEIAPTAPTAPKVDPGLRPQVPSTIDQKPATDMNRKATPGAGEQASEESKRDPLVGLPVFGTDGQKVGEVRDVRKESDGQVKAILIRTGGFLGFGGKTVAIPSGKFARSGQNIQVAMTYEDVSKLPVVDDKAS
jgi:sporulation protein YlmC with PRC-barrel domain